MRFPNSLILIYLGAVIAANVLISRFGPTVAVLNAFLFIGLDLSTRDQLHEQWQSRALWSRMFLLISAGGLLSLLLGGTGRVALASCLAFALAGSADTAVYHLLRQYPWLWRVNTSNLASSVVDSLCFSLIAFGWPVLWGMVFDQLLAKIAGGALWATLLHHIPQRLHATDRP